MATVFVKDMSGKEVRVFHRKSFPVFAPININRVLKDVKCSFGSSFHL